MSTAVKHPYSQIYPIARRVADSIAPYCARLELAGSLRRMKTHIGDIEIVAIPRRGTDLLGDPLKGPTALDQYLDEKGLTFTKRGERYQQFTFGGYTVDLFMPTADTWGSVFTIRTGSWEFSRWLVTSQAAGGAAPPSISFVGGRLYGSGRLLQTPEEADVFAALGLAYIHPRDRIGPIANPPQTEPVWNYAGGSSAAVD